MFTVTQHPLTTDYDINNEVKVSHTKTGVIITPDWISAENLGDLIEILNTIYDIDNGDESSQDFIDAEAAKQ